VTPAELLEVAIERAGARGAALGCIPIPLFEEARREVAGGLPEGPFRGVPFLVKDLNAPMKGVRLTHGSRFYADQVSDHDSELVARYRRAGLVCFGRSASPEFGITTSTESMLFGVTRNPWNPERSAGGSSGGAACAVAAGIVPAAHASDGGGSIRIPASCCGLFGLKPTRARTPSGPDAGEGWSGMSTAHVVSRSVRDSAALLDATHGPESGAPYFAPPVERPFLEELDADPGRLRIALQTGSFNGAETHADCSAAVKGAAVLLSGLGHEVEEKQLGIDAEAFGRASQVIIAANLLASLRERAAVVGREPGPDDLEPATLAMAELVKQADAAEYAAAIRVIHRLGREVAHFLADYDLILTPTLATPPVPLGLLALTNTDIPSLMGSLMATIGYTQLFNATGNPAMSVPLHWNAEGLPIGTQLVARFGDEALLFRVAAQLERERPWSDRRPPL
jgi:Asp-tRNA(Asn)/Glu-tRNA(Gln) amidotransferase A subunit family amidase